jgi:hypothetical protein
MQRRRTSLMGSTNQPTRRWPENVKIEENAETPKGPPQAKGAKLDGGGQELEPN